MTRLLGLLVLAAACAHSASETAPTPPTPPTPSAMKGQIMGMETGDDLKVTVSFHNDSAAACAITSYALAFGHQASAARAKCPPVQLGPNATVQATCSIPDSSPVRDAAGRSEAEMEVVDVASTCQLTK